MIATLARRVKRLEQERGIGRVISVLHEAGTDEYMLDTGGMITREALDALRQKGHSLVIREYPFDYLRV